MRQRAYVEILSTLEVWRARKRRLLIALQIFPSAQLYLDIRTAEAWTNIIVL